MSPEDHRKPTKQSESKDLALRESKQETKEGISTASNNVNSARNRGSYTGLLSYSSHGVPTLKELELLLRLLWSPVYKIASYAFLLEDRCNCWATAGGKSPP